MEVLDSWWKEREDEERVKREVAISSAVKPVAVVDSGSTALLLSGLSVDVSQRLSRIGPVPKLPSSRRTQPQQPPPRFSEFRMNRPTIQRQESRKRSRSWSEKDGTDVIVKKTVIYFECFCRVIRE